jgi:hypothetical protein
VVGDPDIRADALLLTSTGSLAETLEVTLLPAGLQRSLLSLAKN